MGFYIDKSGWRIYHTDLPMQVCLGNPDNNLLYSPLNGANTAVDPGAGRIIHLHIINCSSMFGLKGTYAMVASVNGRQLTSSGISSKAAGGRVYTAGMYASEYINGPFNQEFYIVIKARSVTRDYGAEATQAAGKLLQGKFRWPMAFTPAEKGWHWLRIKVKRMSLEGVLLDLIN